MRQSQYKSPHYHSDIACHDDKDTMLLALVYLKLTQPNFMWISLGDADEYAHEGNKIGFKKSFYQYDQFLKTISNILTENSCYKNTWVVVITDHGRAEKSNWQNHGSNFPASKLTWMLAYNVASIKDRVKQVPFDLSDNVYDTTTIKPLIESLFGI